MKFLFFSDLHLNNALPHARLAEDQDGVTDRLGDQARILRKIRKTAVEQKVDAVFALGDVFDKNRVDGITASEGLLGLKRIAAKKRLLLIRGNHECMRRDGGRNFLESVQAMDDVEYLPDGDVHWFDGDGFRVAFHPLGFCDQKTAREKLKQMAEIRDRDFADCINVLLLHHSILGCRAEGGWVCDDGLGADEVTESGWDWTFSGHFHTSQEFGRDDRGMYLGSTLQLDYGDKGRPCGFWLAEFTKSGCTRTFIDSGAPRFFEGEEDGDISMLPEGGEPAWAKGCRPGDYLRRIYRATRDDWRSGLKAQAQSWKERHLKLGFRADYQYKPIPRARSSRIHVDGIDEDKRRLTPFELAERYVKSPLVEKGELPVIRLLMESRNILGAIDRRALERSEAGAKASLKSVKLENFGAFEEVLLKLRKTGLVWVSGVNHDSDSAKSNGAAKTTLFRGLTWGLFGETTSEKDRDEVIRLGEKQATVTIKLTNDYEIVRTRKRGSEKLSVKHKGFDIEPPVDGLQSAINSLLGMNFNLWRNIVLYAQDDRKRFWSSKDAARKDIMYDMLSLDLYRQAYELAKVRRFKCRKEVEGNEAELEKLVAAAGELDLEGLKNDVNTWEEERKTRVAELVEEAKQALQRARKAAKKVASADDGAVERAQKKLKWLRVAELLLAQHRALVKRREALAEEARIEASGERAGLHREHALKTEALAGLADAERCPVCNSKLGVGDAGKHVKELRAAVASLETKLKRATSYEAEKESAQSACRAELKLVELRRERLERSRALAERDLERAEAEASRSDEDDELANEAREAARRATESAKEARDAENPYKKRYAAAIKRARELVDASDELKTLVQKSRESEAVFNFWMDGFGTQGIPSWLLDEAMPELTKRANSYLETLADGDIFVEFDTQRELKSGKGEFRDEISSTWVIEEQANVLPSGGQWRKMELATDLALIDIVADRAGIAPNLMVMDEVLDGLDEEGRSRVVQVLAELRARRDSIFVISHSVGMSELFERELTVIKRGGVARLEDAS